MGQEQENPKSNRVSERLVELDIALPEASKPLFQYVPVTIHQGIAYISGQLPWSDKTLLHTGKVGQEVSIEEARYCAEICVLRALSSLQAEIGSLDLLERVLQVTGYVQSAQNFFQQPKVIDAASELLERIFREKGRHSRVAIGVSGLPSNAPVEISFIVAVNVEK